MLSLVYIATGRSLLTGVNCSLARTRRQPGLALCWTTRYDIALMRCLYISDIVLSTTCNGSHEICAIECTDGCVKNELGMVPEYFFPSCTCIKSEEMGLSAIGDFD